MNETWMNKNQNLWQCNHIWETISRHTSWASSGTSDDEPPKDTLIYLHQRCTLCGMERSVIERERDE